MDTYRKELCSSVVFTAVLILLAIPAVAQLPTGAILGVAKDTSGGVLPNATVTITNVDTGLTRVVKTSDDGSFRVPELAVGHYEVKGEHAGFKTETRKGITLEVTDQAVVNLIFEVGSEAQQVIVTGEASIVNTQNATLGGLVTVENIENLPLNGRNYVDLTLLQPGVNKDRNVADPGTSFSVNGAPPRSNNFTLDGAILQNQTGRGPASLSGTALGVDGIMEYKIVTSNFSAEYGLAMGSQMVAVSKSGTNQFHGDAFEYLRNSRLDAKNFFDKHSEKIPEFQKNQFGGAFGGPIKKDKTFFYAVYEGVRQNLGLTENLSVPAPGCHGNAGDIITLANCPDLSGNNDDAGNQINSVTISPNTAPFLALYHNPDPSTPGDSNNLPGYVYGDHSRTPENYGQIRVDQNFSSSDMLFGRWTIDNAVLDKGPDQNLAYFRTLESTRNQWITLAENHIFSPALLNTVRVSFSRTHNVQSTNNVGLSNGNLGPPIRTGFPTGVIDIGGVAGGDYSEIGSANNFPKNFAVQNIYTLSDDFVWTRGKHAFKFGFLGNRWNEGNQSNNSADGQIQFADIAHFMMSKPYLVEFEPPFANENRFNVFHTLGFYGQDDWRATPRLTVNLGLRYEFMTTPREINGRQSHLVNDFTDAFVIGPVMKNNTLRDFSPRIGLAYDLFGNGKTAIRSGFGIYYDIGNIGSALGQNAIGAPPFSGLVDITESSNPAVGSFFDCCGQPPGSGFPFPIPDSILNSYTATTPGVLTPQFMDYNFLSPYMIQYNASVQQQLPWNMALAVAYVGNHGVHLATIREGNPIFPTSTGPCGDPASLCVNGRVQFWDTSAPNYAVVNPNIGSTINVGTFSQSRYNALQVVLSKRTSRGLEFEISYTHSRVTDDTQGQENVRDCLVAGGLLGTDALHPRQVDTGPACFNVPNNFEFNMTYHLPNVMKGNGLLSKMANGWWMSSIVSIQSGEPFSVILAGNRSNSGVLQGQADRVNINTPALIAKYWNPALCTSLPGQPAAGSNPCPYTPIPYDPNTVITGKVSQWFNPAMFSISPNCAGPALTNCSPTLGQLGTSGRNILPGPPQREWDFSLVKDTKIGFLGERGMVQFRAEFFNVLNHPNFGGAHLVAGVFSGNSGDVGPFSEKPSASTGKIRDTGGNDPRQIQLALKILF